MTNNKYKILLVEDETNKFGVKPGEAKYITNELGVGYRMNGEKEE